MFTLTIRLGNEAMQTPGDVAGLLERLAGTLHNLSDWQAEGDTGRLRDLNGNTVGEWQFRPDEG